MTKLASFSSFCGIAAPIIMVALWTIASILRPGYNQLTQRGSELGTGPNSIVMNVNFVITGILIILLTVGLIKNVHAGPWSTTGIIFLGICGSGEIFAGFFPCDPGCPLTGSPSQFVHTGIAVVFFGSISIAPLLVSLGLEKDPFWRSYRNYSLMTGVASVAGFVAFSWSVLTVFLYIGLVQRVYLAFPFLWMGVLANHLRSSRTLVT